MSAQQRVFSSPELLASILLQLPQRDFFLAQRVSPLWQSVVTTKSIQQEKLYEICDENRDRRVNGLLASVFDCFFEPGRKDDRDIKHCFWADTGNKIAAVTRQGASWRRMLPAHPPIKALRIRVDSSAMGGDCTTYRWTKGTGPNGNVTMGQVYDICASWVLREHPVAKFAVNLTAAEKSSVPGASTASGLVGDHGFDMTEVADVYLRWVVQCTGEEINDTSAQDFLSVEGSYDFHYIQEESEWRDVTASDDSLYD